MTRPDRSRSTFACRKAFLAPWRRAFALICLPCILLLPDAAEAGLLQTGVKTDLAIQGPGFFVVRDPRTNQRFATRAGAFKEDPQGYLVTLTGMRVQGYCTPALTELGDLTPVRIEPEGYVEMTWSF